MGSYFFFETRGEIDKEWTFVDGSYVSVHQHASGARHGEERAIGMSRGGSTSKIHIIVDAHGNIIDFELTGGHVHDSQVASLLLDKIADANYFIADKGYDAEYIREKARDYDIIPVIPRKKNSKKKNPEFDKYLYKLRHLVENIFARLKHFRSIATRYDKLARNFKSMIYLASSFVWMQLTL